jgi:hypothetical protein
LAGLCHFVITREAWLTSLPQFPRLRGW